MTEMPNSSELPPPEVVPARPVQAPPERIQATPAGAPAPEAALMLPTLSQRGAALDLLLVLLVALLALGGLSLAVYLLVPANGPDELLTPGMLMVQEWFQVLVALGLLVFLLRRRNLPPAAFGLQLHQAGRQLAWGAAGLGLTYCWIVVSLIAVMAALLVYPSLQSDLMKRQELLELLPVDSLWRTIALMVPVAVSEEVLFRGLLLPYLRRLTGYWWPAVVISTCVFAGLHYRQGVIGILQISGVAAIFAVVFIYSRSLLATIVAHFGFDVGQVLLLRLAQDMFKAKGIG